MATTLPANTTKANFDAGTDDPKQARAEFATNADIQNTLKSALGDFAQLSNPAGSGLQVVAQGGGTPDDIRIHHAHERKTATYTAVAADRSKLLEFDSASALTLDLTAAATLIEGWFVNIHNSGAGPLTVDPNAAELIDDSGQIVLGQGQSATIFCDGTAFWTVGKSRSDLIRKTSDQTVNNSTTKVNDDHLFATLVANETIHFILFFAHVGNDTADMKFAFSVPSGAILIWSMANARVSISNILADGEVVTTSGSDSNVQGSTGNRAQVIHGTVRNSTTAGLLRLQWAQNTAAVVDTKILTDSYLMVWRA